jgi:hypothetical protein
MEKRVWGGWGGGVYLRTWDDMKRDAKRGNGHGVLGGNGSIGMRLGLVWVAV